MATLSSGRSNQRHKEHSAMRAVKLLVLGVVLGIAVLPLAPAQDGKSKDKKDPQSSYEPRSAPGAGQKFLAKFVGEWDVVKTFHPRTGKPARSEGSCVQTMIHEGRFLRSEFTFGTGDAKTTGLGLTGFDAGPGLFTSVWTDSRSTRMSLRRSKDRFDGKQIVLFSKSLDDAGKEARTSRTVTRLEDDGRKIVHRQYTPGAGDKERLVMELVLTRKAAAPAGK
jgi:hypothetical protein